jgi:hypothetical protein
MSKTATEHMNDATVLKSIMFYEWIHGYQITFIV